MSAVIQEPQLNFRPICEMDLNKIVLVENQAYEFPWTTNIFHDCLYVGYNCWLLEEVDELICYGVMSVAAGECHILNLCVTPERQNQNYGQIMLEFLLDTAKRFNADTAFLEVRPSNGDAIRLYDRAGFAEVGIRKNYYPAKQGREDAIILAKSLLNDTP